MAKDERENATEQPEAENPLHRKLGMKPGTTGLIVAPPEGDDNPLLPLPESFSVVSTLDDLEPIAGPFDYIQIFALDRADLASRFSLLRDRLAPNGSLWVSWLKQSSERRSGGQMGDLNENVIRRIALTHSMVDVKVLALDRDWSALRLVHRRR